MSEMYLTPEQWTKLDGMIQECVASNIRIEGEKSFQKDVADRAKDEIGLKPAEFKKLVSEYYDGKVTDSIQKAEAILEIKEQIDTAVKNNKAV